MVFSLEEKLNMISFACKILSEASAEIEEEIFTESEYSVPTFLRLNQVPSNLKETPIGKLTSKELR